MIDKQIIIDGVDVSGYVNFRPDIETTQVNYTNACSIGVWQRWYTNLEPNCIMSCSCKHNPNCYYKQLKAKEQECEELKKIIDEAKNSKLDLKSFLIGEAVQNEYEQQLDQLKAENGELKKKCNIYTCGICGNKEDCNKFYKTLTEIKEIAITGLEGFCPKCSRKECEDNNCIETAIRDILQKISEVEDGGN